LTRVRFTETFALADSRIAIAGQERMIERSEACRLVAAGFAVFATVKVRAICRRCNVGNVIVEAGDVLDVVEEDAIAAYRRSAAVLVDPLAIDPAKLGTPIPLVPPLPPPRDPYEGEPRVKVRALHLTPIPGGTLNPGEEATIPESVAVRGKATGALEKCGVEGWTDRAMRFLEELLNPNPMRPTAQY
jgi:hypothetical protein